MNENILWLKNISINYIKIVGGKNASLGEMYNNLSSQGIKVPNAFVLTTKAFTDFINYNNLKDEIETLLTSINTDDLVELRRKGLLIRTKISNGKFSEKLTNEIFKNYKKLSNLYFDTAGFKQDFTDVAVRSSSTAEDLPDASFAGLQETYLNVRGRSQLLVSIKNCFASLYTDRAISYRKTMNYDKNVAISVCIQKMARSDLGSAGVAFSIDSESGFKDIVLINGSWGLGEMVVGGRIKPDEVVVFKKKLHDNFVPIIDKKLGNKTHKMIYGTNPDSKTEVVNVSKEQQKHFCLTDEQFLQLSKWVVTIEDYYTKINNKWSPMDIEWAYDGLCNELFIVQARPETVNSNKNINEFIEYKISSNDQKPIITGISVGDKIGSGKVKILYSLDGRGDGTSPKDFEHGDILVTDITDPDWEPIMKKASAIITNKGGRVCHAAIVARELGIPSIVGTLNCTQVLSNNDEVTVSCAEGEVGYVYKGILPYEIIKTDISKLPKIKTEILLNIGSPENAFKTSFLPNNGVGLAREEFIINNFIGIHPLALLNHENLEDKKVKNKISKAIVGFKNGKEFFIEKLSYGIARIAAAFYPKNVIVRLSDFKSNEYYNLLGGKYYEPIESNPMIGWRGCSRYYSKQYTEAFGLECEAIKKVRKYYGFN